MAFLKNTEINTITEGTQVDFPRTQEVQWRPLFKKKNVQVGYQSFGQLTSSIWENVFFLNSHFDFTGSFETL